jgi:hypothetical protein
VKVRFVKPARDEPRDGIQFYELERKGLGQDFRDEVRAAVALIREYPLAWQSFSANTRRCVLRRFPFDNGNLFPAHRISLLDRIGFALARSLILLPVGREV